MRSIPLHGVCAQSGFNGAISQNRINPLLIFLPFIKKH
ncbi:hypothetical protein EAKF1_ch2412 [Escherichia albertii KF1]|nr:hypothetical protein EAKF1_ch2412 [Escherichia albertii KF1]